MRQTVDRIIGSRPRRFTVLIFGLVVTYVVVDAWGVVAGGGYSYLDALVAPPSRSVFDRTVVSLLALVGYSVVRVWFARYEQTARELVAEKERLRMLYDRNPSGVITLDRDLVVSYLNEQAAETVGLPAEEVSGQVCHKAIMGSDEPCDGCLVGQVFATGKAHSRIKHERTSGGRENWLSQVWYPLMAPDGSVESVVEIASDVSAVKLDPLTSLPNRLLLRDRLEIALASAKRHGQLMAVVFMDIDGFKQVNDTMGHAAGDALLTGFAERLRGIVRQDETLARISGDEFVLLLPSLGGREEVGHTALRILEHLTTPFAVGGRPYPVSASLGIALFDGGDESPEELLDRADAAMYEAKAQGGNTYRAAAPAKR